MDWPARRRTRPPMPPRPSRSTPRSCPSADGVRQTLSPFPRLGDNRPGRNTCVPTSGQRGTNQPALVADGLVSVAPQKLARALFWLHAARPLIIQGGRVCSRPSRAGRLGLSRRFLAPTRRRLPILDGDVQLPAPSPSRVTIPLGSQGAESRLPDSPRGASVPNGRRGEAPGHDDTERAGRVLAQARLECEREEPKGVHERSRMATTTSGDSDTRKWLNSR